MSRGQKIIMYCTCAGIYDGICGVPDRVGGAEKSEERSADGTTVCNMVRGIQPSPGPCVGT